MLLRTIFLFLLPLAISNEYPGEKLYNEQQMVEIDEETFTSDLKNFIENGTTSENIKYFLDYIDKDEFYMPSAANNARFEIPTLRCIMCRGTLGYLIGRRRLGDSRNNLAQSAVILCRLATSFSQEICEGVVNLNIDTILFILDSRPNLNQKSICAVILQRECGRLDDSLDFHLNISSHPPDLSSSKTVSSSTSDIKIIHFTDIHFDPLYVVGGATQCQDPLCCRKEATSNNTMKAGYWGDYGKCDMPLHTIEQAFKHMAEKQRDADFIYFTGDSIPHNVWNTNVATNIEIMEKIYQLMKDSFGTKTIYPILGNHEAHPVNVFAPSSVIEEEYSDRWLFNFTASKWSTWLPKEAMETVLKGGYYTVLIKPGLRLIALNNNNCYIFNWWIHYSIEDIIEQLQWMHDTLLTAEKNNEKVHVLIHIPSGEGSCFQYWSREYRRIIERFSRTISAQFNGHSHYSEFNVFYESENSGNPVNVAWNGGSITTYFDLNPNYNIYFVDAENFEVNNYESWIFNLTEANENIAINPRWYKQYSFKDDFKISDLSPSSLDSLLVSMTTSRSKARQYFGYKFKNDDSSFQVGCQDDCLRQHICDITMNEVGDFRRCEELLKNTFSSD